MTTVHLVEDDDFIREALVTALSERGYDVSASATGRAATAAILDDPPDAVILDLGLPDIDGAELLDLLRSRSDVPVIIATARADEAEIIRLLDAGADDYLVKPFSAEQLAARLRAVRRRAPSGDRTEPIEVGGLVIDLVSHVATLDGRELELSRKEFDLLTYLARHEGEIVSRAELLAEVWRQPLGGSDKTIDVHLSWLRRKLGESALEPRYIHTSRGVGIKLVAPPDERSPA